MKRDKRPRGEPSVNKPTPPGRNPGNSRKTMPAAHVGRVTASFTKKKLANDVLEVEGRDLVFVETGEITTPALMSLPANPAYWSGTRIAQLAPAYTMYRPIKFALEYVPFVAVTQSGIITMGTQFDIGYAAESLEKSLLTSNGGCMSQCYTRFTMRVALNQTTLQQANFTLNGALSDKTNPFNAMAVLSGASVQTGYFLVHYTYRLSNPTGQTYSYLTSGPSTYATLPNPGYPNVSLVIMSPFSTFGPGTTFDVETDGVKYRGSAVSIPDETVCYLYQNGQSLAQSADGLDLSLWKYGTGEIVSEYAYYVPTSRTLYIKVTSSTTSMPSTNIYTSSPYNLGIPEGCELISTSTTSSSWNIPESVNVTLPSTLQSSRILVAKM